ncbi:MAG: hypothetical protein LBU98_01110 [Alistipes sp.]|jgi:hypothetical protein|nr:hypothetical protein [Alistipes sp.]
MKKLLLMTALVAAACAVITPSCKTEDPVPVVSITTQPTAPAGLTEGSVAGSLIVAASVTEGAAGAVSVRTAAVTVSVGAAPTVSITAQPHHRQHAPAGGGLGHGCV